MKYEYNYVWYRNIIKLWSLIGKSNAMRWLNNSNFLNRLRSFTAAIIPTHRVEIAPTNSKEKKLYTNLFISSTSHSSHSTLKWSKKIFQSWERIRININAAFQVQFKHIFSRISIDHIVKAQTPRIIIESII